MTRDEHARLSALATTWEARRTACMESGQRQAAEIYKDCGKELRVQLVKILSENSAQAKREGYSD